MIHSFSPRRRLAAAITALAIAACASQSPAASQAGLESGASGPGPAQTRPDRLSPQAAPTRSEADTLAVRAAQTGLASWYGEPFHGRLTASGEVFDKNALTAAHPTWPLRSLARVTRVDSGARVLVRINDRGPFVEGRIIDLSRAAAEALGFTDEGLAEVRVESLGPADPADRAARSRILPRD